MNAAATSIAARWTQGSTLWRTVSSPAPQECLSSSITFRLSTSALGRSALLVATVACCVALGAVAPLPALLLAAAFAAPSAATALLPLAFAASWRFALGGTADEDLFLRASDALAMGALLRLLVLPDAASATRLRELDAFGPVLTASLLLFAALLASALAGIAQGTLAAPQAALLPALQWAALAAAGLLAWVHAPALGRYGLLAWCAAITTAAGFGLAEIVAPLEPAARYRAFERLWFDGQSNHYGGLFAFAACAGAGLAMQLRSRILGVGLALIATAGLYAAQSRSSMLALAAGLAVLAVLRVPRLLWLLPLAPLAVFLLPDAITPAPGSSMHDRLVAWKSALSTLATYPLLGLGAGARHRSFYDNHYIMTIAECGLLGLAALAYWQATIAKALAFRGNALALGLLAGWAALAVHALANISFFVTVCAGPALWITGYALAAQNQERG